MMSIDVLRKTNMKMPIYGIMINSMKHMITKGVNIELIIFRLEVL